MSCAGDDQPQQLCCSGSSSRGSVARERGVAAFHVRCLLPPRGAMCLDAHALTARCTAVTAAAAAGGGGMRRYCALQKILRRAWDTRCKSHPPHVIAIYHIESQVTCNEALTR